MKDIKKQNKLDEKSKKFMFDMARHEKQSNTAIERLNNEIRGQELFYPIKSVSKKEVEEMYPTAPLKYSGGFMNKEIDFMHVEDGDVISIEARANKNDGEKYISLGLSHKCNEGSVILWLSELKRLTAILEGEISGGDEDPKSIFIKELKTDINIKNNIIESQASAIEVISDKLCKYEREVRSLKEQDKIYANKLCKQKKHITKLIAKNKELKEEIRELNNEIDWDDSYEGGRP